MSAKGRKKVEENEFYPTPRDAIITLLESNIVKLPGGRWIEPCAGTGRIISTANEFRSDVEWIICEIDERFDDHLRPLVRPGSNDHIVPYGDFVNRPWPYDDADVLIMNPPFSLTLQFVIAGLLRASYVVCLQRKSWFGTKERAPWLAKYCPDDYTLPARPSFRPDGRTDATEYSWFVWPPGSAEGRRAGRIAMLDFPTGGQIDLF